LTLQKNIRSFFKDMVRAFALIWKAGKFIALVNVVLLIVQALLPILLLYFLRDLIEGVVHGNKSFSTIMPIIIYYGIVQLLTIITGQVSTYVGTIQQQKLTDNLSAEVLEKAVKVDYAYYENPTYHDSMHLAQQQAIYKASIILSSFNAMLLNSLSLVFLVAFFISMHLLFALPFTAVLIPLAAVKWYSGYALLRMEHKFVAAEREANYLQGVLTGITSAKEIRLFGFGNSFIKKFKTIRASIHHEKNKLNLRLTWYSLFAESAEVIAMLVIFGILAKYTWLHIITIGAFVIYIQGFQRLQSTAKSFLQAMVQIFQQRLFLNDLFKFLDMHTDGGSTGDKPFTVADKGIRINNLSFTYPGTDRVILKDISIQCKPGSIVAIVGENGSGKSTLVKLLGRLYDVKPGSIKLEDSNYADIGISEFQKNTIFLFQDFEQYMFTVEENITLSDIERKKTNAEIVSAAQFSGASQFIDKLSHGYATRLGRLFKSGEQLSGGQWQKLALSRAFYKDAQLVILDEPTSAMDASAEYEVFNNIKTQMVDKMVFLITHRLYNLKIADHIYVLKDGIINQEGSFDTLIKTPGLFKEMYDKQKL
jgi:ATP-binding cassette subfamily B protein